MVGPAPTDASATSLPPPTATAAPSPTPAPTLIPSATPTPTALPCRETAGQIKRFELLSPYLKKPLNYRMYFPPCYDDSGETRYPVLYMLHGQTYNDDQWVRLGIGTALDELIVAKAVRPFLIVLPYEVDTFADPYADGYGKALLETLIPWIDAFHPTCAEAACRAIGELSRGGAWSFLLALDHPELFGAAGGHSMVPFGGMARRLPNQLRAMPEGGLPRLWIDTGQGRYLPAGPEGIRGTADPARGAPRVHADRRRPRGEILVGARAGIPALVRGRVSPGIRIKPQRSQRSQREEEIDYKNLTKRRSRRRESKQFGFSYNSSKILCALCVLCGCSLFRDCPCQPL